MTGSVIQLSMNFGYPGSYARTPDDIVMNKPVKSDSANIPFGSAVILNSNNTYSLGGATLTADNFAGIAVREVKQGITYATYGVIDEQGEYRPYDPCDVLLRGNTVIKMGPGQTNHAAPTAGGQVYFRIATDSTNAPNAKVGDFEVASTVSQDATVVALPNVVFTTGEVDANGIIEVSIKSRNNN